MKLYLAYKEYSGLMESSEELLGVFSTKDKALDCIKKHYDFNEYEPVKHRNTKEVIPNIWVNYYGDDSWYLEIRTCILDKEINGTEENN